MAKNTPVVWRGKLIDTVLEISIELETDEWLYWLNENQTFYFDGIEGTFTARKEKRKQYDYWYAYRKIDGRTCKKYLGLGEKLTMDYMNEKAYQLFWDN